MDVDEDTDKQDLTLQAVIEPDAAEILGIPPEEVQQAQGEQMEEEVDYGSSPQGEEPLVGTGDSSKEERPELPYAASSEEKYGNYIVSQLTRFQEQTLRHWVVAMGRFVDRADPDPAPVPRSLEDMNTFQIAMMVDFVADATHQEFHMSFPVLTGLQVSHEDFHELHVVCNDHVRKNSHISVKTFENEDDPQIPVNPHGKDMEFMIPEDKHIILEGDNSKLVDCTVTWLNMLNKDLQQKVLSRLHETNKLQFKQEEVGDEDEEEEREARKDPVIPPPKKVSIEVQTDMSGRSDEHGSSPQGEVPSSFTGSTKVEEVREKKPQEDDTAPETEILYLLFLQHQKCLEMKVLLFFKT